jgi:hypothetical protein
MLGGHASPVKSCDFSEHLLRNPGNAAALG